MTIIVTKAGPGPDDWAGPAPVAFDVLKDGAPPEGALAVDFPNDRDPEGLAPWFDRIALIRVAFPAMGDGRGFSIARRLRGLGYRGRLRAAGPLIADQVTAALGVGFDEIEVSEKVAARQPAGQWAAPRALSYQRRLLGG